MRVPECRSRPGLADERADPLWAQDYEVSLGAASYANAVHFYVSSDDMCGAGRVSRHRRREQTMFIDSGVVLSDGNYDCLRTGILEPRHAPGDAITESAVALRYGVAHPTAKIVIERLVTGGRRSKRQPSPLWRREGLSLLEPSRRIASFSLVPSPMPHSPSRTLPSTASWSRASRAPAWPGCMPSSWARSNSASGRCKPIS